MNGATTIQERLKDLRLNKGLKLEELAEQTGISKSALGSYEKDDYKPPISAMMNISATWFLMTSISLSGIFGKPTKKTARVHPRPPLLMN